MNAPHQAIGHRVAQARGFRRLTQQALAARVGVPVNTIWKLENAYNLKQGPSVFLLQSIARELGVSADYLLGLSEEMDHNGVPS